MAFGYSVYFSERPKNRVVRWDPDSGATQIVAGEGPSDDRDQSLNDPYGLAFDRDGFLLIADKNRGRVCRLRQGRLEPLTLRVVDDHRAPLPGGPPGFVPDYFPHPTSLFTERSGSVLCCFHGDQTIYRIHPDGRLELMMGVVRNRYYDFVAVLEGAPPAEVPNFPICGPTGIVARSDGALFFIERNFKVVRRYDPTTGLHSVFPVKLQDAWIHASQAPLAGTLDSYHPGSPTCLALDSEEHLYLCDPQHGCVVLVDPERGEFRRVLQSSRPPGDHPGAGPTALAFGPDGTAWVADSAMRMLQGYSIDRAGQWTPVSEQLACIGSSPLALVNGGMGLAVGP